MPYTLRNNNYPKQSPIDYYRNFVLCGNNKCKVSCDSNRLFCVGCQHWFHYECAGLSKKAYLDYVNRKLTFVCDRSCSALMMPFSKLSHNDLMLNFDKTNQYPCGKCKKECLGSKKMNSIGYDECP